nr:hypothetical protein [Kibdelosporangium sp. MJ126-NF4]CTQ88426.1 hypothetical protein [Kibdelosporangium sp. MJ126-NF4]
MVVLAATALTRSTADRKTRYQHTDSTDLLCGDTFSFSNTGMNTWPVVSALPEERTKGTTAHGQWEAR